MEFTHYHRQCPDAPNGCWRCPYCGHEGFEQESTIHLPKCPWPALEESRLEIERLRGLTSHLEGLLEECREHVMLAIEAGLMPPTASTLNLLSRLHTAIGSGENG